MDTFWMLFSGALVASTCALVGCFLILRKTAMIADAIAHAVLPGIIIAFLLPVLLKSWSVTAGLGAWLHADSFSSSPLLIGAITFGVLTTFSIEVLIKKVRLQKDAAIGFIFTTLFAFGVILVSSFAENIHIDQDCIVEGELAFISLGDAITMGDFFIPKASLTLLVVFIVVVAGLFYCYKGLSFISFDEAYAKSQGINTTKWHYVLMAVVSVITIVSFEAVGAILVVAFLIIPAATAYLITQRLSVMLVSSVGFGCLATVLGFLMAQQFDVSITASMATMSGLQFFAVFGAQQVKKLR